MIDTRPISELDPELAALIHKDVARQRSNIQLIASENFVSIAMMQASGSVLSNKYSEGYPGRRYYEGCQVVDEVENLARERAKSLFGAEHANVQAHSGSQANMGAYFGVLDPGDTILGMRLDQGGHLTHGSPVSFSGGVRGRPRDRDDRHGRGSASRPRTSTQDDHCRVFGVLTNHRLGVVPRDRRRSRRHLLGRRGPHHRADRGASPPEPGAARRYRDRHDPQGAPGPTRRTRAVS